MSLLRKPRRVGVLAILGTGRIVPHACFVLACPGKIQYHQCGIPDTEDADILVPGRSSLNFIEQALDKDSSACVLVHCASGVSRSVAVVIHYLMRVECMKFHAALRRIRSIHPAANPNRAFMAQLEALDHENSGVGGHGGTSSTFDCGAAQPTRSPSDMTRRLSWQRIPSVESVGWMTRSSYPAEKPCGWMQRIPSVPQVKSVFVTGEEEGEGKSPRLAVQEVAADDANDEDSKSVASTARLEGETSETSDPEEDTRCEGTSSQREDTRCDRDGSNTSSPRACVHKSLPPPVPAAKPKLFWHTV